MSFIEGGGKFIDFREEFKFETTDPEEWEKHAKETGIVEVGAKPCAMCKKEVTFDNLPFGKSPICEECKGEIS
jgi:hypothetical protein